MREDLGQPMDRATLAKIENGTKKNIGLDEVLMLAFAVGVSPIHLIFPREMEAEVAIGNRTLSGEIARAWTRGITVPQPEDERFFTQEVAEEDYIAHREGFWRLSVVTNALSHHVARLGGNSDRWVPGMVERIEEELGSVKRQLKRRQEADGLDP